MIVNTYRCDRCNILSDQPGKSNWHLIEVTRMNDNLAVPAWQHLCGHCSQDLNRFMKQQQT